MACMQLFTDMMTFKSRKDLNPFSCQCIRINYGKVQDSVYHGHHDALSSHDSLLKVASRQPRDARSMPPTPLLTRSAFSSTHLR